LLDSPLEEGRFEPLVPPANESGLTSLAQHIVVVAGSRLDREGCGLRALSGSKENTSFEALEALAANHFSRSER
jgi:hypothetical protein